MILTEDEQKKLLMKNSGKSLADIFPELVSEWGENGDLTPYMVTPSSKLKVQWKMPYDIENKHFDFEWEASINSRTYGKRGCPFLTNQAVWAGFNDLATTNPELAKEWHPTKNGNLKPYDVTGGTSRKVWWYLPYDDIETGKHFDFEWEASIHSRVEGNGCPYLSNTKIYIGYNDLATTNPELAQEWHPTKNGNLRPNDVTNGMSRKVWWYLPFDDPETGKHFDFEWEASVVNRVSGCGCPYLSTPAKAVWVGYNDLATTNPNLAKEWHPSKNRNESVENVLATSGKKIWWKCSYGHEWQAVIGSRATGIGCPICSKEKQTSFPEQALYYYCLKYFCDATNRAVVAGCEVDVYIPSLKVATEYDGYAWHRDKEEKDIKKNKQLSEAGITLLRIREFGLRELEGCNNYILLGNNKNNKYLEKSIIYLLRFLGINILQEEINISKDKSEVYKLTLTKQKDNSVLVRYPSIAAEWDYDKNIVGPEMFPAMSNHRVWWKCINNHSYEAQIAKRTLGNTGCPYCCNNAVLSGYNDLVTISPELVKEWHPTKNGDLTPYDVLATSSRKVWWYLPYDDPDTGKHFDFEWETEIRLRTNGTGCPFISGQKVWIGYNDLATTNPELASEWHPTKNGKLKPTDVTKGSGKRVWWFLSYYDSKTDKCFDFEWEATIDSRVRGNGNPFLYNRLVMPGFNDLATKEPEIAQDWDNEKNGELT